MDSARRTTHALFSLTELALGSRNSGRVLRRLDDARRAFQSLTPSRRFTLLVDESGQSAARPPPRGYFVWGGCVVADRDLPWIESWWRRRQRLFTYDVTAEVKATHLFTARAPATDNMEKWLLAPMAKVLLDHFLSLGAIPLVLSVDKGTAGPSTLRTGTDGKRRIDRANMLLYMTTVYSAWLERQHGTGRIVMDHLSSPSEEAEVQSRWSSLRRCGGPAPLERIHERIEFTHSSSNEGVQLADHVVGCFRQALQWDPNFSNTWGHLVKAADRVGLGLYHLS